MSHNKHPDRPNKVPDTDPNVEKDPPSDLRVEWQNENVEIEDRKPTLEEDEEDTGDL